MQLTLPTEVGSHCLARSKNLTPDILEQNLDEDQALGYSSAVIVPALLKNKRHTPNKLAKPFLKRKMRGRVCGFVRGDGPSPFKEPQLVLKEIEPQARIAAVFAEEGIASPSLFGPIHEHYRQPLPAEWTESLEFVWLESLEKFLTQFGLTAVYEPLNDVEDKTRKPFELLYNWVKDRDSDLQLDLGHFRMREHTLADFERMADKVKFLEFANVGRWPLAMDKGIDFPAFVKLLMKLRKDCEVGVEPFCQAVIKAFGLERLCDTTVEGADALMQDAAYLRQLGVMAKTA